MSPTGLSEVYLTFSLSDKEEKQKLLKQDEKAHKSQLQRKALYNSKTKKAERAQGKANQKAEKVMSAADDAAS
jgi:hypothetical protein